MDPENPKTAERNKRIDELLAKGIREDHLTSDDLRQAFPDVASNSSELDAITKALTEMGIPVLDLDDDALLDEEELVEQEDEVEIEIAPTSYMEAACPCWTPRKRCAWRRPCKRASWRRCACRKRIRA
jgi:hypothetical protein